MEIKTDIWICVSRNGGKRLNGNKTGECDSHHYAEVMQKSYMNYAVGVIISRALPDVRDGLKPVQKNPV